MITFKFSQSQKTRQVDNNPFGGYTDWIDIDGMEFNEASIEIGRAAGFNVDPEIVTDALEYGWIGIHHSGCGYIAKAMI